MAFKGGARNPVAIKSILLYLERDGDGNQAANYAIEVEYDTGETDRHRGNLIPILTQQERTQAQAFVDNLWTRAEEHLNIT